MPVLLDSLVETVDNCSKKGAIDGQDMLEIIREMECLNEKLFENYDEFVEENKMQKYMRYSTMLFEERDLKIARNMLAKGISPELVAYTTELPLTKVKALLRKMIKENQAIEPLKDMVERNRLEIAINLQDDGLTPDRVARNTGLTLRKVKALLQ
jgi:hypothetical protein